MDQPGAAHAVPALSAAQKALLMRSWRNADRPAVYLAVAGLIQATSKDELKSLLWQARFWAIQNDCLCKPDAWAAWQGYILKEAEEARLKAERAARKQVVGARVFPDV